MNIGINLNGFWPGRIGGAETYVRNLIDNLQLIDHSNSYTLLCHEEIMAEIPIASKNFSIRMSSFRKSSMKKLFWSILWNTLRIDPLRAMPRYLNCDVIHHPFALIHREWNRLPSVLTFFDLQHEYYPEYFSRDELLKRRDNYRRSALAATRIIAISQYSKKSLMEFYGIPEEKIDVIYLGSSPVFKQATDEMRMAEVRDKYFFTKPFLYYPAATWPHKNHKNLFLALKAITEKGTFDGELVLTGVATDDYETVLAEISRLGLSESVRILGHVSYEDIPYIYALARVMVFPSLFEGFGIPLVESMTAGCPIACSNAASIPEVVGNAAAMFDPNDFKEMEKVIKKVWESESLRSELKGKGIERAGLFNWHDTAQQTLDVYQRAVS